MPKSGQMKFDHKYFFVFLERGAFENNILSERILVDIIESLKKSDSSVFLETLWMNMVM